jgi:putative copper export protein
MTGRLRNSLKLSLSLVTFSLLVSLAWIGHPAAVNEQPLGVLGDALHLAAAGIWLGGLPCLAIYLAVTRETASPRLLQRFSTLSLSCVSVLAVSGLSNAWLLVGSVRALLTTRYGALLLGKLALFALLLVLGARNRILVRKISVEPGGELVSRLARKVTSEIILGFGVIAIVSWLGVTPPARDARISMAPPLSNEPVFARSPCCDTQTIPCE